MNFDKIIDSLIQEFKDCSLNEADTRFKIIDTILQDILSWPRESASCEKYIEGNRADYVLYSKRSTPVLVIESKKEGVYFELPEFVNSNQNFTTVQVRKLLTDSNIKDAMLQVKEYCEDLACSYAAITNGHVWIIFRVNSQNQPWKTLPAFIIKGIEFFKENYTQAINLLGYNAVIKQGSLKKSIGVTRVENAETFYPKEAISSYGASVNNNHFASILNPIARKYLGNIHFDDSDFVNNCYVVDRGQYDDLQKNVQGVIYDSLTPFFKNEGFLDIRDDLSAGRGGAFAFKIQEIIRRENLDNVMILFGGRGAGKSSFIKRLLYHVKPQEIEQYAITTVVDLIDAPQTLEEITKEIWLRVNQGVDKDNVLDANRTGLLDLFSDRFESYKRQVLEGIPENTTDYNKEVNRFIRERKADIKYCCQRLSFYWKSKNKGLVVILDNLDQLKPVELQDTCFLTAIEIAKKLGCLVVISMREERFYNAKMKGVLDAYHTPGYHLASPVIPSVISKRLKFTVREVERRKDEFLSDITDKQVNTIIDFLNICNKEVTRRGAALGDFLRYATHGDVRQALEFFKGFLTSGYTNINEISSNRDWKLQSHQVLKPMMIPNRFFYDEKVSKIPNIYQLRSNSNSSHFSGIRILYHLNEYSHDNGNGGFIDAKYFVQKFETDYNSKEDCEKHLDVFLNRGLVESSNRLEEYTDQVDQIKITAFGKYMLDYLSTDFTYLDLISLDCGNFDLVLHNFFVNSAEKEIKYFYDGDFYNRILSRLLRVEKFIEYLKNQEEREFQSLGMLGDEVSFAKIISDKFYKQKNKVIKSAQNKVENYR